MSLIRVATAVPLPYISDEPAVFYSPSTAVLVMGIPAMITIILFVTNSLASNALARLNINPLPRVLISAGIMIAVVVAFVLVAVHDQNAHKARISEHLREEDAARAETITALEAFYGFTIEKSAVPIEADRFNYTPEIEWPDGRIEECLLSAQRGYYEIRCGSDKWDTATPLPPAEATS